MTLSSFFINPQSIVVADASVVINLCATIHAKEILAVRPHPFAVTDIVCNELLKGVAKGCESALLLRDLIDEGIVERTSLGDQGVIIYESLVIGSTENTLDDGEAATISHAFERAGVAMIDERKAIKICMRDYPELEVVSTTDLLLHERVEDALGSEKHAEIVFSALQTRRMNVPKKHIATVVALLGPERVARCVSLPRSSVK